MKTRSWLENVPHIFHTTHRSHLPETMKESFHSLGIKILQGKTTKRIYPGR